MDEPVPAAGGDSQYVTCLPNTHQGVKTSFGKEPWNVTVNKVTAWQVTSHNKRLVCDLHRIQKRGGHKVRNYSVSLTLSKEKDALKPLVSAVHLEGTVQRMANSS